MWPEVIWVAAIPPPAGTPPSFGLPPSSPFARFDKNTFADEIINLVTFLKVYIRANSEMKALLPQLLVHSADPARLLRRFANSIPLPEFVSWNHQQKGNILQPCFFPLPFLLACFVFSKARKPLSTATQVQHTSARSLSLSPGYLQPHL